MLALGLSRLELARVVQIQLATSPGKTETDAADSSYYDWGYEAVVAVDVNAGEDEQDNRAQERRPLRSNWRCLCPRADWRTNQERSDATGSPVWIQCATDGALALLRQ